MSLATIVGTAICVIVAPVSLLLAYLGVKQMQAQVHYRRSGCNVPKVPQKPFIGSFKLGVQHQIRYDYHQQFGPVVYYSMLHAPYISTTDPDIIQYVLARENFPKGPFFQKLAIFWGDDLVTMQHGESKPWKKERRLVDPAFKIANLKAMTPTFASHAKAFTDILLHYAQTTDSFDFTIDVSKITLDIISSSGFSYPIQLSDVSRKRNDFLVALNSFLYGLANPLLLVPYGINILSWLHRKQRAILDRTFYKVIDERLTELESGKRTGNEEVRDLLDAMLVPDEDGNRLTREQIRNELFVFYLAGHETTATVLSWLIYLLCQHPEVEKKLLEELETVMGPIDGKTVLTPTNEQLDRLEYMKMVLNETLRLYSPAASVGRVVTETFEFKGYLFPKGVPLACNVFSLHRDPSIWPDPLKFDPERFSKENSAGRHLYAFVPFSAGPRICIGKNFFYLEAKMLLATLLRVVKFELDTTKESGQYHTLDPLVKPASVWVRAHKRLPA